MTAALGNPSANAGRGTAKATADGEFFGVRRRGDRITTFFTAAQNVRFWG